MPRNSTEFRFSSCSRIRPRFRRRMAFEVLPPRTLLATVPPGFAETAVADNLSSATAMEFAPNGTGGAIQFGPDDKLYVAAGENATPANSQSLNNALGKILRINPDGSIPTDNPFVATATNKGQAIWALGLRNPFTFAFHPITG